MRQIILISILIANAYYADGWIKGYDFKMLDIGTSVRPTNDGGFIIVGYTTEGFGEDILMVKTDSMGDTLWTKIFGGSGEDVAACVQQSKDGGYIVTGHLSVEPCLIKVKPNGDTAWIRTYGYGGANWVEQTTDGGFILTGRIGGAYMWILKTDKDGDTLWSKWYQWGDDTEVGNCIRQTWDGSYIVATNMGLLKTDKNGDSVWMKPWASVCVEETSDYGYILASEQNGDIWLIKTDWRGDTLWTKTYGGAGEENSSEVHQLSDDGYVIIGNTSSFGLPKQDVWVLRTDKNGDTLWTRTHYSQGKLTVAYSGQQTSDGGYIITGSTTLFSEDIWPDVLLIKTDSLGYVGIAEPVIPPAQTNWQVVSPIGSTVTLRYSNLPQGFHAFVYDASGRKVDEMRSQGESGTITWGQGVSTGVYFIKTNSPNILATKVVLLK